MDGQTDVIKYFDEHRRSFKMTIFQASIRTDVRTLFRTILLIEVVAQA